MDPSKLKLATQKYLEASYDEALTLYEDLHHKEPHNPYLSINLGNTYYQLKSYGKAIKNYYQAKRFLPRNKELNNNVTLVVSEIKQKQPPMLGFNGLNLLESLVLVLVFNIVLIFRTRISTRKVVHGLILVGFFITVANLGFVSYEQSMKHYAVITSVSAQIHSGDNQAYAELGELADGQIVELILKDKTWSQIKFNDQIGWVKNNDFEQI